MRTKTILTTLLTGSVIALPASAQNRSSAPVDSAYVPGPYRGFTGAGEPASLDDIVAAMGRQQVVFIGEAHDDPTGHMLEAPAREGSRWAAAAPAAPPMRPSERVSA